MAKKFGKVLLFAAAAASAATAVCYFLRKKDNETDTGEEDDYDDFSDDLEESDNSHGYVALNPDAADTTTEAAPEETSEDETAGDQDSFTPLNEQVAEAMDKAEESVEAFFDEDEEDPGEENPETSEI